MSLLPTSMRDPDMQPLGPPLRLKNPPQPDRRAENMAKWFENGQFEIDAGSGLPVDADDPFRARGHHDELNAMLEQQKIRAELKKFAQDMAAASGGIVAGVDLGRPGGDESVVCIRRGNQIHHAFEAMRQKMCDAICNPPIITGA